MPEEDGFQHVLFTDNIAAAFHHNNAGFGTRDDNVEIGLLPLGDDWLIFVDFLDEGRRRDAAVDLRRLFICQETRH